MLRQFSRLLIVLALSTCPLQAAAQSDPFAILFGEDTGVDSSADDRPGEDDVRFVGLRLGGLKLRDTITAYERPEGLCLVAKGLLEVLEAPVVLEEDTAQGWFVSPDRTLRIDFTAATATLRQDLPMDLEGQIFPSPDGWCLTETAWSRLLPINFTYDPGNMLVRMEPRELLPLEARLERDALRALLDQSPGRVQPDYRDIENPYRWLSWPTADISVDLRTNSVGALTTKSTLDVSGDVLWATARLRTVDGASGGTGLRMTLDRVFDPGPGSWAPRQARLGDVSGLDQPLMSRSQNGRGLMITNTPTYTAEVFDMTEIRGPLPEGWDAELYRESQLLDYITESDSQGEYVFKDVEILPGYNRFTVNLYGPFGEVETREVKFFAGSEMRPENDVQYQFALLQEGVAVDGQALGDQQAVAAASVNIGLNQGLSTRVDVRASGDGELAATASMSAARGSTHGVIRIGDGTQKSPALESGVAHQFEDRSSFEARYFWLGGDLNDDTGSAQTRRQSLQLRYDTVLPVTDWGLPLQAKLDWEDTPDGGQRTSLAARVASSISAWRWTHLASLDHTTSKTGVANTALGGRFAVSRQLDGLRLRASVDYDAAPAASVNSVDVTLQKRLDRGGFAQLSLSRDMQSQRTQSSVSYAHTFGDFTLSATGGMDDSGAWTSGLRLSTALFFDTRRGIYRTAPTGLTRSGAVRATVYDDIDEDGHLMDSDATIEGAGFILDQSIRRNETGPDGTVVLTGVEPHRPMNIELSLGSLDDPFLQPTEPGLAITVRPGQVLDINVPLTLTGEAEATVLLERGETRVPVAGVTVEALDATGRILARADSEYDGYVYLDGLPMGELQLRISPHALDAVGGVASEIDISLERSDPYTFGHLLVISETGEPNPQS
ncbi:MAG: hypothetical protein AAF216_09365 [Pseudomonadota bacterium]